MSYLEPVMTGKPDTLDPESHLPLGPRDFQVLLLVFDQPMHGYGIVKASADEFGGSVLDLGSLYRIIGRLTRNGLLEDVTGELDDSKRQRRYYRATPLGRQVARAAAVRLRRLLASERAELLWEKP
jgi:DNA-binding PadR family transcriptional regulator